MLPYHSPVPGAFINCALTVGLLKELLLTGKSREVWNGEKITFCLQRAHPSHAASLSCPEPPPQIVLCCIRVQTRC